MRWPRVVIGRSLRQNSIRCKGGYSEAFTLQQSRGNKMSQRNKSILYVNGLFLCVYIYNYFSLFGVVHYLFKQIFSLAVIS